MRALAVVLGVAFLARLGAVLWLADTIPYTDYFYYHEAGRLQAEDWRFFFRPETVTRYGKLNWWPPGYPMFLAAIYSLVGPDFRVAVFVQVVLGTAVCALVFATASRAAGRGVGLAAALLVAVNPTYVFTTNLLASENLFALWLAMAMEFTCRARRALAALGPGGTPAAHRKRWAVLAGGVYALATLTRAVGLPLVLVAAAWVRQGASPRRAGNLTAVWLLAGFAVVLAPWTLRNAVVARSPALVCFGGGLNFYFGNNDAPPGYRELGQTELSGIGDPAAIDRAGWRIGLRHLAAHPLDFPIRGLEKLGSLFASPTYALHANSAILIPDPKAQPELADEAAAKRARQAAKDRLLHGPLAFVAALHSYLLLAAAALACILGWRRLPDAMRLAAWICIAWLVVHFVFWAQPRFRYPIEIPMALLAGWAVVCRFVDRHRGAVT